MAEQAGIDTKQLLAVLENWKRQGKLRRIGAIVDYFKVGLSGGGMAIWQVEPERVEQTVARMSQACGVSNYCILVTEKELKKVPPTYITELGANNTKEEE